MSILAHQSDRTVSSNRQIPAAGTLPDAETLFVGAVLWSLPDDAKHVLLYVRDDDLGSPDLRSILAAIREVLATGGVFTPAVILGRLQRRNGPRTGVVNALMACLTSGAASCPESLRDHAAQVVAGALRRRLESGGHALQSAASGSGEADLLHLAGQVADTARDISARLAALRGEVL